MDITNHEALSFARAHMKTVTGLPHGTFPMLRTYDRRLDGRRCQFRYVHPETKLDFMIMELVVRKSGEIVVTQDRVKDVTRIMTQKGLVPDEKRVGDRNDTPLVRLWCAFENVLAFREDWFLGLEFNPKKNWPRARIRDIDGREIRVVVTVWGSSRRKAEYFSKKSEDAQRTRVGLVIRRTQDAIDIRNNLYDRLRNMRLNGAFGN